MKTFAGELLRFERMLVEHAPFSLARFGDGEMVILMGGHPQLRKHVVGHEYDYDPGDPGQRASRDTMLAAFHHRQDGYYVGISCPHCVAAEEFEWLREASGQDEHHLTFATLYFYANYKRYRERVVPLYAGYDVWLVCSAQAVLERLPFAPSRCYRVGRNAWVDDAHLIDELKRDLDRHRPRGALVLICAGPFGGVLAHQLAVHAPDNTYLDAGSSLDPLFFAGAAGLTRRYLKGGGATDETCFWTAPGAAQRRRA
jgi:hypothetical protein